jgi:hypothetical protein
MKRTLILVKYEDMSLLYNYNNPRIISFNVKVLLVPTPLIKKKKIGELKYDFFSIHNVIKYLPSFFIQSSN